MTQQNKNTTTPETTPTAPTTPETTLEQVLEELQAMRKELQQTREEKKALEDQVKEFVATDAAKQAGAIHAERRERAMMDRGNKEKQFRVRVAFVGQGKDQKVFTENIVIPHFANVNWLPFWVKKIYKAYAVYHEKDFGLVTARNIQGRPKVEPVEADTLDFIGKKIGDLNLWQACKAAIYYGLVLTKLDIADEYGSLQSLWFGYKSYVLNEQNVDMNDFDENLVLKA